MRKRSAYRPKTVLANPLAYVLEGLEPVTSHGSYLLDLKIKNHGAMALLTQGKAKRQDIDTLIRLANVCEALYHLGFGVEYQDVVKQGMAALWGVGQRGVDAGRYILRSSEMAALNEMMDLHDAQMGVVTVKDVDRAVALVRREYSAKRMRPIVFKAVTA